MNVVAAIICNENNKVLLCQRKKSENLDSSLSWEFPGGKQIPGETLFQALSREIHEELECPVVKANLLTSIETQSGGNTFPIHFFMTKVSGSLSPLILWPGKPYLRHTRKT